jgi:hypothetical protein
MERQNKIVGIIGRKGSGKSTVLQYLLRPIRRLFVFDTMGEHSVIWIKDQIPDMEVVHIYLEDVSNPKEEFQASYVPTADILTEFDVIADDVYRAGNMTFGIEELPMLTKSAGYMQPSLGRIFRLGRHQALNIVWTAQRAAEVPRGVTGATDYFILFQQTEPGDIKALEYRCGAECAQMVTQLGLHDFLTFDVVTREIGTAKNFVDVDSHILLRSGAVSDGKQNVKQNLWKGTEYADA